MKGYGCTNCIIDVELSALIESHNEIGSCKICNSDSVYLISNNELKSIISMNLLEIVNLYKDVQYQIATKEYDVELDRNLFDSLLEDWNIFNINSDQLVKLLDNLFEENQMYNNLRYKKVFAPSLYNELSYKYSINPSNNWNEFRDRLKYISRFHNRDLKLNDFKPFIDYSKVSIKKGEKFYRARKSTNGKPIPPSKMGAPPKEKVGPGRVNPQGISYLYLCNEMDTSIHEIRSKIHDYVVIGEFKAKEDLHIVDFTRIANLSPFITEDIPLESHLINHDFLKKIGEEMARPQLSHHSPLDYLPTQFISEYIATIGYDGIKYNSTLKGNGINFAIFNEKKLYCKKSILIQIEQMDVTYNKVESDEPKSIFH